MAREGGWTPLARRVAAWHERCVAAERYPLHKTREHRTVNANATTPAATLAAPVSTEEQLVRLAPAVEECRRVSRANGWDPADTEVLALIRLWEGVRQGDRNELGLDVRRLAYVRRMVQQGRFTDSCS
jgi:hypothetical protein